MSCRVNIISLSCAFFYQNYFLSRYVYLKTFTLSDIEFKEGRGKSIKQKTLEMFKF